MNSLKVAATRGSNFHKIRMDLGSHEEKRRDISLFDGRINRNIYFHQLRKGNFLLWEGIIELCSRLESV